MLLHAGRATITSKIGVAVALLCILILKISCNSDYNGVALAFSSLPQSSGLLWTHGCRPVMSSSWKLTVAPCSHRTAPSSIEDLVSSQALTMTAKNKDDEERNRNQSLPSAKLVHYSDNRPKEVEQAIYLYTSHWQTKHRYQDQRDDDHYSQIKGYHKGIRKGVVEAYDQEFRKYCKQQDRLKLKVRNNITIIEYHEKRGPSGSYCDGSIIEYHIYPEKPTTAVRTEERITLPFNWRIIVKQSAQYFGLTIAGFIAGIVFKVPNFGLGRHFSLKSVGPSILGAGIRVFRWMKDLFTKLGVLISSNSIIDFLFALVIAGVMVMLLGTTAGLIFSDIDEDNFSVVDHDNRMSRNMAMPSTKTSLFLMGNRFKPIQAFLASSAIGLGAGLSEEIIFRGVFQTVLARRLYEPLAIILQSALFGICHFGYGTTGYVLGSGAFGVFMGLLYHKTSNLAFCILIHALWDAVVLFKVHERSTELTNKELSDLYYGNPTSESSSASVPS